MDDGQTVPTCCHKSTCFLKENQTEILTDRSFAEDVLVILGFKATHCFSVALVDMQVQVVKISPLGPYECRDDDDLRENAAARNAIGNRKVSQFALAWLQTGVVGRKDESCRTAKMKNPRSLGGSLCARNPSTHSQTALVRSG
jgi:hypothetical protein